MTFRINSNIPKRTPPSSPIPYHTIPNVLNVLNVLNFRVRKKKSKMPQLSKEQRVFVVKCYYQTQKNSVVRDLFRQHFPDHDPPKKTTIWRNVQKYGTSLNAPKKVQFLVYPFEILILKNSVFV